MSLLPGDEFRIDLIVERNVSKTGSTNKMSSMTLNRKEVHEIGMFLMFFYKINNWTFWYYYRLDTIIIKVDMNWIELFIFSQLKSWPQTIWYPMKKGVTAVNQKQIAYSVHPMQNVPGVVILTHVMINPKTIPCVYTQIPNWGLINAPVALISYIALTVYQPNLMGLVNG